MPWWFFYTTDLYLAKRFVEFIYFICFWLLSQWQNSRLTHSLDWRRYMLKGWWLMLFYWGLWAFFLCFLYYLYFWLVLFRFLRSITYAVITFFIIVFLTHLLEIRFRFNILRCVWILFRYLANRWKFIPWCFGVIIWALVSISNWAIRLWAITTI